MIECEVCKRSNSACNNYCFHCGEILGEAAHCACGHEIRAYYIFCVACGNSIVQEPRK